MTPDALEELLGEVEDLVTKEMFDATYEHVDAVKGPAHGMRFIVMKAFLNSRDVSEELRTLRGERRSNDPGRSAGRRVPPGSY